MASTPDTKILEVYYIWSPRLGHTLDWKLTVFSGGKFSDEHLEDGGPSGAVGVGEWANLEDLYFRLVGLPVWVRTDTPKSDSLDDRGTLGLRQILDFEC